MDTIRPHLKQLLPKLLPSLLNDVESGLAPLFAQRESMVKAAAHSGHVRALREMHAPEVKLKRYAGLDFHAIQLT